MPRRTYAQRLVQALAARCPDVWADVDGSSVWLTLPNTAAARTWLPDDRRAAITDQVVDDILIRAATWLRAERPKYNQRSKDAADVMLWILDHPSDPEPHDPFIPASTQPVDLTGPGLHLAQLAHDQQGRVQLILDSTPPGILLGYPISDRIGPGYHQAWQWGTGRLTPDAHAWLMQQWRAHAAPCDLATEQGALVKFMRGASQARATGQPNPYADTLDRLMATFPGSDKPRRLDK